MSRQRLSLPRFVFRRDDRSRVVLGALGAAASVLVMAVLPASAAPGPRSAAGPAAGAPVARAVATLPVWGYVLPIDTHSSSYPAITGVSCSSPSFCAAVDNAGNALLFKGRTWSRPVNIDTNTYGFTSVSCANSKFCVAMDADGYRSTWNGSHWRAPTLTDPESVPSDPSVSCPTVSFCAVVDQFGKGALWNGTKWTTTTVAGGGDEQSVSCVSSSFCVAGDLSGVVYTWNGKKWSGPSNVDPGAAITAVSCVRGPFCVAAGANAETFNGSKWTPHGPIAPVDLESAACVTSRFCIVGDDVGDAYVWNGGRFSNQGMIDPDASISALSCRSTWFCAAVDSNGHGLFWARPPLITTFKLPEATRSDRYVARLTEEGGQVGPYVWHRIAGSLPNGLALSVSGDISGTPKRAGTFRFVIRVTDPLGQHFQRHFAIKVER